MKPLIRVFPSRTHFTPTDDLAFVGDPPLPGFRPAQAEVHISCTFTWDLAEAERLVAAWSQYYPDVKLGGPAVRVHRGGCFTPGRYIKPGVTFTSRGCNAACKFCLVRRREGKLRELQHFASGHIIQDNNFLQTSPEHQERVFAMLRRQRRGAVFAGGLDKRLITDEFVGQLRTIKVKDVFLAFDNERELPDLYHAYSMLSWVGADRDKAREKLHCYVLLAFDEKDTPEAAEERLRTVWNVGFMPFPMLYQPPGPEKRNYRGTAWQKLASAWRPIRAKRRMAQEANCGKLYQSSIPHKSGGFVK